MKDNTSEELYDLEQDRDGVIDSVVTAEHKKKQIDFTRKAIAEFLKQNSEFVGYLMDSREK